MGLFSRNKKNKNGELCKVELRHILGLAIPEGLYCKAILSNQELILEASSNQYKLNLDKIYSVDFSMNVDVEKYQKTSISKGIVGAATFGVVGAVIGSSPTNKEKRNVTGKIIIEYLNSNEENQFIILEDFTVNSQAAATLIDKIRPLIKNDIKNTIEL